MSCLLCMDTSTDVCSAAVCCDGETLFDREDHAGPNHAERLGSFVDEALSYVDGHRLALDAVAVCGGPGSYTGLRIGVSMAKGICYGRGLRLVAVPTPELLCVAALDSAEIATADDKDTALLCPMLDARRMEVYAALYDMSMTCVREIRADIVDGDTYRAFLDRRRVFFFGDGAAKCMEAIGHPNARLVNNILPLARNIMPLAERRLADGRTEDVAYYEPFYLKDFVAGKPRTIKDMI